MNLLKEFSMEQPGRQAELITTMILTAIQDKKMLSYRQI